MSITALDATKNFIKVTLSTGYDSAATSVVLVAGEGASLPNPASGQYNMVWWNFSDYNDPSDDPNVEVVRGTALSVDTLTITRAQEGTSAANHNTAGKTYKMILTPTSKMITDINTNLQDAQTQINNIKASFPFGGTGADGALSISSGTTTIDLGFAAVVVKNYTSISITGTANVVFTNPNTNGTNVLFKSQGNVIITSSATAAISLDGMGAAGSTTDGASGHAARGLINGPSEGLGGSLSSGGAGGNPVLNVGVIYGKAIVVYPGGGGGRGNGGTNSGNGGNGGGGFYIECAGALDFTGTITSKGLAGGNAGPSAGTVGGGGGGGSYNGGWGGQFNGNASIAGGGGGGGGGTVVIVAATITTNTGTITLTGGTGGTGVTGGNGGDGYSLVTTNTEFI